jgi:hypothetical protein
LTVFDLYSKRQKRQRGEVPDVYVYDALPQAIRIQIVHLWKDVLGDEKDYHDSYKGVQSAYRFIVETLRREYGVFELVPPNRYRGQNEFEELHNFILNEADIERCLDVVELSFRFADKFARRYDYRSLVGYAPRTFWRLDSPGRFENGTRCVPYGCIPFLEVGLSNDRRCYVPAGSFFFTVVTERRAAV